MSVLELRRVSKSYGEGTAEVHALREVSLTADEATMVALMGPSGSSKSTLGQGGDAYAGGDQGLHDVMLYVFHDDA